MEYLIPVPESVTELIEWDRLDGLTNFVQGDVDSPMEIIVFVPRGLDTAHKRAVRRHEFLHVEHDAPDPTAEPIASHRTLNFSVPGALAYQAIGDVFVHLRYWPEDDAQANADAVVMAMEHLQRGVAHLAHRGEPEWSESISLLIVLRSMSILLKAGSAAEQLAGEQLVLKLYDAEVVAELRHILQLVEADQRAEAEAAFSALAERREGAVN